MTDLPRAHSRPGSLPLWAEMRDGRLRGICHFEAGGPPPGDYRPIYGDEPTIDPDRQFFIDSFDVQPDHVIRHRIVYSREG